MRARRGAVDAERSCQRGCGGALQAEGPAEQGRGPKFRQVGAGIRPRQRSATAKNQTEEPAEAGRGVKPGQMGALSRGGRNAPGPQLRARGSGAQP